MWARLACFPLPPGDVQYLLLLIGVIGIAAHFTYCRLADTLMMIIITNSTAK